MQGTHRSGTASESLAAVACKRVLRLFVLPLCLFALSHPSPAQQPAQQLAQLPAPAAQLPASTAPTGSISGFIVDGQNASIASATVTLSRDGQPPAQDRTAVSAADGSFFFANVPPGPFKLVVSAAGFAPSHATGVLSPGDALDVPSIALPAAASSAEVDVTASQTEIAEAQVGEEEKQRVLGVFPNFYVSYVSDPVPLDPRQKYQLALRTLVDPVSLVLNGVIAGSEQATNTYAWGQGAQGYGKRYAAAYGNFLTGTLLGDALFPIILKQDPRYFYKGTGSIHSRALYAIANAVICKGDNNRWQVNYSGIAGGLASAGLSNLYYPAVNRSGFGLTFEGAGIGTGFSAVANLLQEFLIHRLTPGIPKHAPPSAVIH
jgi:carboxypeptidase family protein